MTVETMPWALDGQGTTSSEETDSDIARHALQGVLGGAVGSFAGGVSATNAAAHGVCGTDHLEVTQSSTPGMSVRAAAGVAFITGTASAQQGPYSFYNGAAVDDLAITPGDATNDRHDLICARTEDSNFDATGQKRNRLFVVEGTPAGSPVDPTPPDSCLVLARVVVAANESTSILDADITDLRTYAGFEALLRPSALCQVRMSAPQNVTSGAGSSAILYNTEDLDPLGWHSTSVNTDRITPTIPGWYRVTLSAFWTNDTDYTRVFERVLKNGSETVPERWVEGQSATHAAHGSTWPYIQLNGTTDYISTTAFQANTSGNVNTVTAVLLVELVRKT